MFGSNKKTRAQLAKSFWRCRLWTSLWASAKVLLVAMLVPMAGPGEAAESYSDDFVGTVLRPEWRIKNEDPKRFGLVEGNYLLLVSNSAEKNTLTKSIDGSGDFTIELVGHGSFTLAQNGLDWQRPSCISFGVVFPKEDRINITACTDRSRFVKMVDTDFNAIYHGNQKFNRFLLRVQKKGVQYRGVAILDGNEIDLGSHFMPQPPNAIFIRAFNHIEEVPEAGILIDRVSITPN